MVVRRALAFDRVVGANTRARREALGISQKALAKVLGISFQQLQKNESGKNRMSFHRVMMICEALNTTTDELAGLNGVSLLPKRFKGD